MAALTPLAACTSGPAPSPAQPRSALSGGARTCADASAACGRPGALRWVLPLTGAYRVDRPDEHSPGSMLPVALDENGDALSLLSVGETVYLQTGGQVLAVDGATGRVRWRYVSPDAAGLAGDVHGDRLLYRQRVPGVAAGRYVSLDPRTGHARTIPVLDGEDPLDGPGSDLFLIRGLDVFSTATRAGVRRIDPVSGRTRWDTRLRTGRGSAVSDGVLYADDSRERPELSPKLENRWQARSIQRVDLRTGRRLPDVRVPRRYWGDFEVSYVTRRGVIVLGAATSNDKTKHAFTTAGRPVPVPKADPDPGSTSARPEVKVTGPYGGVQRLSGDGWTGPAMRDPGYDTNRLVGSRTQVAVAVACAPDGVRAGTLEDPFPATYCTKPRFFGVTW